MSTLEPAKPMENNKTSCHTLFAPVEIRAALLKQSRSNSDWTVLFNKPSWHNRFFYGIFPILFVFTPTREQGKLTTKVVLVKMIHPRDSSLIKVKMPLY